MAKTGPPPRNIEVLIKYLKKPRTLEEIGAKLGTSYRRTIYRWFEDIEKAGEHRVISGFRMPKKYELQNVA